MIRSPFTLSTPNDLDPHSRSGLECNRMQYREHFLPLSSGEAYNPFGASVDPGFQIVAGAAPNKRVKIEACPVLKGFACLNVPGGLTGAPVPLEA